MRCAVLACALLAGMAFAIPGSAFSQACLPPEEPYPYKPPDDQKLRKLVNEQYAKYMEQVEDYLNCMQLETARAHHEAREILDRWIRYYGNEAGVVMDIPQNKEDTPAD